MTTAPAGYRQPLMIWVWLAGLMLAGVALSSLPIPHRTVVAAVLGLSTVKAVLVALYYMHLKWDARWLTWLALIPVPLSAALLLLTLFDRPLLLIR